jgi:hypothetical protein
MATGDTRLGSLLATWPNDGEKGSLTFGPDAHDLGPSAPESAATSPKSTAMHPTEVLR